MLLRIKALASALALTAVCLAASGVSADAKPALNQTGFTPASRKIAVQITDSKTPLTWVVRDAKGQVVATGQTSPFGFDTASGAKVHQVDFSSLTTRGQGYVLDVAGEASPAFDIAPDVYNRLKYDALAFFYHQRVSVPIEAKYVGERWARPIAHEKEIVACWGPKDHRGNDWGGCPHTLAVPKGWYDAGDHGKYVVNGGISVWTLMHAYEYGQSKGWTGFADGKVKIPEAGNGVNDLLDEARFEMDFLLAMQVPEGVSLTLPLGNQRQTLNALKFTPVDASGMAHHKMHDEHWTPVPTAPHEDREKRGMNYPSTAATLNLAATAAQCARLFRGVDDAYAETCLKAARKAYAAAVRVPDAYAIDILPGGGGGYGDGNLSDEFYWAASELYLTTGETPFEDAMKTSSHYLANGDFSWASTATLGTLSLAASRDTPHKLAARDAIVRRADVLRTETKGQGYAIAFNRPYVWGSNADFANRAMVFGLASDFTGNRTYRDEAVSLMDYILGRNALGFSYVSGYGETAMQHPHHRFWANNGTLPPPPPGALSGGANQNPGDEAVADLKGCAPQTCYRDVIGSYSANEVAINWNAPLVWAAAWLDETKE